MLEGEGAHICTLYKSSDIISRKLIKLLLMTRYLYGDICTFFDICTVNNKQKQAKYYPSEIENLNASTMPNLISNVAAMTNVHWSVISISTKLVSYAG